MVEKSEFALVKRTDAPSLSNYLKYRNYLREDFFYSCAYCTITESEARGISFEIDHYLPKSIFKDLENDYKNLMYSCEKCNSSKRAYYLKESNPNQHEYIIRIDVEDPGKHFMLNDVCIDGITSTGKFNEKKLNLNRYALKRIRELRTRDDRSNKDIIFGGKRLLRLEMDRLDDSIKFSAKSKQHQLLAMSKRIEEEMQKLKDIAKSELLDDEKR